MNIKIENNIVTISDDYADKLIGFNQFKTLVDELYYSNECIEDRRIAIRIVNIICNHPNKLVFEI